jgi:hypothetical protein
MKQDPQQAASFLSHPATHRRNIHEHKANIKQATKERNSGIDNVSYGASLSSSRKNKLRSSPLQLPKPLRPTKQKTQSTLFPFVQKTKAEPHQHRQLFATNNNSDDADSLWSHKQYPSHNTPAPNSSDNTQDNLNSDKHNNTKNEEKTSLPPSDTQQNLTGNTANRPTPSTDVTLLTTNSSQPDPRVTDTTTSTKSTQEPYMMPADIPQPP